MGKIIARPEAKLSVDIFMVGLAFYSRFCYNIERVGEAYGGLTASSRFFTERRAITTEYDLRWRLVGG